VSLWCCLGKDPFFVLVSKQGIGDGFAARKTIVEAVVPANLFLIRTPTEEDFLAVDDGWEIHKADFEVPVAEGAADLGQFMKEGRKAILGLFDAAILFFGCGLEAEFFQLLSGFEDIVHNFPDEGQAFVGERRCEEARSHDGIVG